MNIDMVEDHQSRLALMEPLVFKRCFKCNETEYQALVKLMSLGGKTRADNGFRYWPVDDAMVELKVIRMQARQAAAELLKNR